MAQARRPFRLDIMRAVKDAAAHWLGALGVDIDRQVAVYRDRRPRFLEGLDFAARGATRDPV